jgi:hypothetical protein
MGTPVAIFFPPPGDDDVVVPNIVHTSQTRADMAMSMTVDASAVRSSVEDEQMRGECAAEAIDMYTHSLT